MMSQQEQEQVPEPSTLEDQLHADAEVYRPQHPYTWSAKPGKKGAPRDEPPSSYHEPMIQHDYQGGYVAQDAAAPAEPPPTSAAHDKLQPQGQAQQRQRFSPDGDAFEQGYRPYNTRRPGQVPPWARPRRNNMSPMRKIMLFIVLGILFAMPILGIILSILGALLGVLVFILVLVPFLFIGMSVIFVIVALILRAAGVPIGRGRGRYFKGRRWR